MYPEMDRRLSDSLIPERSPVVLVAEDDVLIRLNVSEYLRSCGFTVLEAASALEAQIVFSTSARIDVVFSDINMPGPRDGIELAQWVEAHHADVPVLLTSGAALALEAAAAVCSNVYHLFPKPYRSDEVVDVMKRVVQACQ